MTLTSLRLLASVGLAVTLLVGVLLSGKARRDVEQRVGDLHDGLAHAGEDTPTPQTEAGAIAFDPLQFERKIGEDAQRFGIESISLLDLARPNAYFDELPTPVKVGPGKTWSSPHLKIRVRLDKVNYVQQGAKIASVHVIARVENVAEVPIAYRLVMRGVEGSCEVRGAREHNAISLRPGEAAEIVVCAGRDSVQLDAVEVLEVTELGHRYLSQLTPAALGFDRTTAAAHHPLVKVDGCEESLDVEGIAGYLQAGTVGWGDVVDFYSRHDCHAFAFFPGYRRAEAPLTTLPVLPPA